jgi:putative sigma-54 modulation protein
MEPRMQTTISSKHINITPAITQYAAKKADKLRRFFDRIQQIDVVIDKARNGYTVEIITDVEHHKPFVATAEDADMYACIDLGVDRASRQLKDHKSRVRDRKHVIPNSHTIDASKTASSRTKRKTAATGQGAARKPGRRTRRAAGSRGKTA